MSEQLQACEVLTAESFSEEDRRQLRRMAAALRFLRRREAAMGERPVSFGAFVRSLERLLTSYARTESPLEREFMALMVENGLGWCFEPQVTLPIALAQPDGSVIPTLCRPDFLVRSARLTVFVDGTSYHNSPDAMAHDAAITYALNLRGWRVLRVNTRTLRDRPAIVLEQIRQALDVGAAA